jgi:hypothetical protein
MRNNIEGKCKKTNREQDKKKSSQYFFLAEEMDDGNASLFP